MKSGACKDEPCIWKYCAQAEIGQDMKQDMKLSELFEGIDCRIEMGSLNTEISGIQVDSRLIRPGDLFVAMVGAKADGHDFIRQALDAGAAAVLCERGRSFGPQVNAVKAMPGLHGDGHEDHGSIAKVDDGSAQTATVLSVPDARRVLSRLVNRFYKDPSKKFTLIGVTGTNGKTSVASITSAVLSTLGQSTGLLGTLGTFFWGESIDMEQTTPTTPDCVELGAIMAYMATEKADSLIMEVSSMGLKTGRVSACDFDVAVFTNISPEHLDDHGTMDDYKASKRLLFGMARRAVINVDDDFAPALIETANGNGHAILAYGIENSACCDLYAKNIVYTTAGVSFDIVLRANPFDGKLDQGMQAVCAERGYLDEDSTQQGQDHGSGESAAIFKQDSAWREQDPSRQELGSAQHAPDFEMSAARLSVPVSLNIPSAFAVYNALAAVGACLATGADFVQAAKAVQGDILVPGRYEVIESGRGDGISAIVDYAHTAKALENLLAAVRANPSYSRIISVFGCGGDRDNSKRAPMGEISGRIADYSIITSDNPRTEDPLAIIAEIVPGIDATGAAYEIEPDRGSAIKKAVLMAEPGDIIVIAGKGHEDYQILGTEKIHFDDREAVRDAFRAGLGKR
jgi:UDP-N-acetylmuramoyl-L-alanyl-D-glutamate--2,6-diaminopimelate ligase